MATTRRQSFQREVALVETSNESGRFVAQTTFAIDGLENRSLDAVASLISPSGNRLRDVYRHVFLKKPDWVDTDEGYSDTVMEPWTPLKARQSSDGAVEIKVWGRRYIFDKTLILGRSKPKAINSWLHRSPSGLVSMVEKSSGKIARFFLKDVSQTKVRLEQTCRSKALALRVGTRIEYDGYMVFDCQFEPQRNLNLQQLTLELPLETSHVSLLYGDRVLPPDPEISINAWYSGGIPGDMAFRFSGCIWIGDEQRGLIWQSETDEDWHCADKQKAIEILPRGDTTFFRANLVDMSTPLTSGEKLHYKFALQATPIKPMLRDSWDLRLVRSEPWGRDLDMAELTTRGEPTVQYRLDAGVRYAFYEVHDIWPYPLPVHEQFAHRLHRLIDLSHAHGLMLYPYLIHERFPTVVPEFDIHGLHMENLLLKPYVTFGPSDPNARRPGPLTTKYGENSQGAVMFCPKSMALQDAWIHSLARRLDEYGDDGVCLDGTGAIVPCQNMAHGCGYRTEDGTIRATHPAVGVRQLMKRIYTVVKQRRPDGVVDLHGSYGYNPGVLGFADVLWTGEQWWHLRESGAGHAASTLTLDKFRAEFMGYQFGVAAETLSYRLGTPMQVSATSLLHDVPVRVNTATLDFFDTMSKLWHVRDQFGAKDARKLFYLGQPRVCDGIPRSLLLNPVTSSRERRVGSSLKSGS